MKKTIKDLTPEQKSHYENCARVLLRDIPHNDDDVLLIAVRAIGDWRSFKDWADWYTSEGRGVVG